MRTTIEIPEELLTELVKLSGTTKKTEAMHLAIEDFVRRKKIETFLSLPTDIKIEDVSSELEQKEIEELEGTD